MNEAEAPMDPAEVQTAQPAQTAAPATAEPAAPVAAQPAAPEVQPGDVQQPTQTNPTA